MQYLILKKGKKNWVALTIITVRGNQKNAFASLKRKNNETTKQKVINIDKNNVDSNIAIFSNTAKEYNRK